MFSRAFKNSSECGRVYINSDKQFQFQIKCQICLRVFKQWTHFTLHMSLTHDDFKRNYLIEEKLNDANGNFFKSSCEKENKWKQKPTLPISTEGVLRAENIEPESELCEKENLQSSDFILDIMPKYTDQQGVLDEESIVRLEVEILPKFSEITGETNITQDNLEKNYLFDNTMETVGSAARSFFQLRTTHSSIILGFIDIFRRHPCQWNQLDYEFAHKEKRDESAKKICTELKDYFNICISPQLARSSILSLIRWFEREYLRSLQLSKTKIKSKRGRWSRDGYVCAHPAYFNKLLEFIPFSHLQLVCCNKCQREFKTQNQLLVHNHYTHGDDAPFKCRHCKRSFLHPSTWKHHENRHTKKHVWNCPLCRHISSTKTDYNLHMVAHTDIRAYVCDLCGASYKSSTSLNVHLRTHKPPRLQCNICCKKFYENYRLKRHLLIHEAEASVKANVNK
ncbi:zinc finger protein 567-like isoform X1 [Anastrepha ludens]|uniref:zinc finger protein 567-like isoform X1 n=1 Tax=Anastrepha ludens TaxID=28586 RepID=UPI0023AE9605|nr:zinc finger protein 567-like isoform X1 [Anastrepha ludens]